MHEHGTGDAACAVGGNAIEQRHVIGNDDDFGRDALGMGDLGCEAEIQTIAGVILDDENCTGWPCGGPDAGENCVDTRRGENISDDRSAQNARSDEPAMRWFMPRSAAGKDGGRGALVVRANRCG